MWGLLLGAVAWAGLQVESVEGCVTIEEVAFELHRAVDTDVLARIDLEVAVTEEALLVRVRDGSDVLWSKLAAVGPEDCPAVPLLVVRTVEQALSELPPRVFATRLRPAELEGAMRLAPLPLGRPRWSLVGLGSGPVAGRTRWMAGVSVSTEGLRSRPERGIEVVEALVRVGPGFDLGSGSRGVRLGAWAAAGGAWFLPVQETPPLQTRVLPSVRGELSATWVPAGALRVGLVGSVPAIRYEFLDTDTGVVVVGPAWRLGLQLGVAWVRGE